MRETVRTVKSGHPRLAFFNRDKRLWSLRLIIICIALVLFGRLYQLQIQHGARWVALANNQHRLSQALRAERGSIYVHDETSLSPLAVNREYQLVYVVPKDIPDPVKTATLLASVLDIPENEIRQRIEQRRDDPFEVIKKRLSSDEVRKIEELKMPGVHFLPENYRYYPGDELASKVVGFVGPADDGAMGIYGIEASYNSELHGRDGILSQEKDAAGRWIPLSDRNQVPAANGMSVVLTIDRVIQYEVERMLADAREQYKADEVSALVLEPTTGKILALSSLPHFNPNEYQQVEDLSRFMNPVISLPYEPGSIMKPLTMAIGIEEKKVNPNTEYVDTGVVVEAGYAIRNAEDKVYGRSSMTRVLEESINTGVMYVEGLVGNAQYREYLERFGFGAKTGIRLPAEHAGNLKNLNNPKATIQFYTASFGQGVTVTPLQMIMAYGSLANGGVLMKPMIVDRYIHEDGSEEMLEPQAVRQVVSSETASVVGKMLRSVVVNGHGKRADVPGYSVVGKTGTAQVAKTGSKGYEENLTIGSFVGYAPLEDPKYVVLVKVDNPKDVQWAESSAAPLFGKIMQFLLSYGKVQPTEEGNTK